MRRTLLALALTLACAAPAAAEISTDSAAVALQLRGAPFDTDAAVRQAGALAAAGRRDEAEAEYRRVIAAAPGYWDAHVGLARIAYWRGDIAEAERRLAPALTGAPTSPDVRDLSRTLADARAVQLSPWRVDLGVSRSKLTAGLPAWTEGTVSLSRRLPGRDDYVAASVQAAERFDRRDVYFEGLYGRPMLGGEAYVAIGGTPNADFRPEAQVRAGLMAPLNSQGLSGGIDVGWASFAAEDVTSVRGTLRQAFLDDRFALQGSVVNLWTDDGRSLTGYGVQGEAGLSRDLRLILGYANAPETSEGRVVRVKSTSAGLRYSFSGGRALGLTWLHEDRGAYDRDDLMLTTTVRF